MAIVIKPITVEVSKPNVFQAIAAKQNDSNSRFLKVTFANEGEKITVTHSAEVTINAERNDGQSNSFFGVVNDDGTVTVPIHSWILALPGYVNCDVSIIEGDSKLTSTTFTLLVEEASHGSGNISEDEQYDVLTELINELKSIDVVALAASIDKKIDKENIVQTTGDSETAVMSQKAVTDGLSEIVSKEISPNLLNLETVITDKYVSSGNLYDNDTLVTTDYIPVNIGDILHYQYQNDLTGRKDSAEQNLAAFRFIESYDEDKNFITGSVKTACSSYTVSSGAYVRITIQKNLFNNSNFKDCAIVKYKGTIYPFYPFGSIAKMQLNPLLFEDYTKEQIDSYSGLSAAVSHFLGDFTTSAKALAINATATLDGAFTKFNVGLCDTSKNIKMSVTVDDTNITLYNYGYGTPTESQYQHGLTISNSLSVKIVSDRKEEYSISIQSMGNEYVTPKFYPIKSSLCIAYCKLEQGGTSTVDISVTSPEIIKPIWAFGDSYFGYNEARWTFHLLTKDKPSNVLIDGYGGENSVNSIKSFSSLLQHGTPNYVVWCLGMNDGSDTDLPSTAWENAVTQLINACNESKIKIILATIPSVPGINHEKKNDWVRNSGFRYIDFAKAVGATSSGEWYNGMLSSDNVHPTELGAKALYYRAIMDAPELLS